MTNRIIVQGKGGIYAEIIADSINPQGDRITTFQLHYHRYIHSEFMTHRMFSRNASSSRAIPVNSMLEKIRDEPATPIHWGKNKAGMQSDVELDTLIKFCGYLDSVEFNKKDAWNEAVASSCTYAEGFSEAGYHKQIVNRLTEPFQFMNVVCSATDYDNFFFLRCHPDAQPEIQELAECMYRAREESVPEILRHDEWHTPYVKHKRLYDTNELCYVDDDGARISKEDAVKISSSCCAQVSYRKNDTSLEKALMIYDRLVGMSPLHASPFEHIATPFTEDEIMNRISAENVLRKAGIYDAGVRYCGNFRGWTQFRKTLKDENIIRYDR